jgi:energy-coupling factor transport system permease protein
VKWAAFFLVLVLIYIAPDWYWMVGAVAVGGLVAVTARAPLGWLALMLTIHTPTILALVVIPMLGEDFTFDAGFAFGLRMALGWVAAILIGVALFSTMEIDELVDGLRGLGLPSRFAFAVGYAFVLIYLSLSDLAMVTDSMRLKGHRLSLKHPLEFLRTVPIMLVPAMLTVMRRGGAMTGALETRGFAAGPARLESPRLDGFDWLVLFVAAALNVAAVAARLGFA